MDPAVAAPAGRRWRERGTALLGLPAGLAAAIFALSWLPDVAASPPLAASFRAAGLVLLAWAAALAVRSATEARVLALRFVPVRAHWVQTVVHTVLYGAWARQWPGVAEHAPHIAAQVLFYYAFDLLQAWSRRDEARTGFGPLPIVLSVNLFLWFRDDWFHWQFILLALGAAGKEWIRWRRDGRPAHVFNPSSFPLFWACLALWAVGADDATWARDIAVTLEAVPRAYLVIFALGLVVQSLFAVTLVTLSAVAALYGLNMAYTAATGVHLWTQVGIPVAVFLGCHFLVTDPATSPRTPGGRLAFGALYGAAVFGLYLVLREVDGPTWYDKLLCVPVLNLMVRRLDRPGSARVVGAPNLVHVAILTGLFAWLMVSGFLGPGHPGRSVAFWERACEARRWHACESWSDVADEACHNGAWARCADLATALEDGTRVEKDLVDAGYHYALACQEQVGTACARLPGFLAEGGEEALAAACDDGDGLPCQVLGAVLAGGFGVEAWPERARALRERACSLGVTEGCVTAEANGKR